jgi:hypothetical protein
MVRAEAGVDVKVLGPQELPACALSNDRVLQYVFCIFLLVHLHASRVIMHAHMQQCFCTSEQSHASMQHIA